MELHVNLSYTTLGFILSAGFTRNCTQRPSKSVATVGVNITFELLVDAMLCYAVLDETREGFQYIPLHNSTW